MYPNLSYVFHDLFGTAPDNAFSVINMFGFFLALAFVASAYVLYLEFKRMEAAHILHPSKIILEVGKPLSWPDVIWNGVFGFILGFKILYIFQHFNEVKLDIAGAVFSSKGHLGGGVLLGLVMGAWRWWDLSQKAKVKRETKTLLLYPHQQVADITIVAAVSGILGAKIFALFEGPGSFKAFLQDPVGQLFSGSGLAIYGGLIVAFFSVFYYVHKKGMPTIRVMDAAAPAMIMGYAVGRIGCQVAGDGDWGINNTLPKPDWFFLPDWMWAYTFPRNVLHDGIPIEGCVGYYCNQLATPVFPTPFYEVILSLIIFGVLWALRKRINIPGIIFFIYCILNGLERFFIEKIRVNEKIPLGSLELSQAEIISFLVFILGIAGCLYLWLRSRRSQPV